MVSKKKTGGHSTKNMLAGPKTFAWPTFTADACKSVLRQLKACFEKLNFCKPNCERRKLGRGSETGSSAAAAPPGNEDSHAGPMEKESQENCWKDVRHLLFIGINQTTRAMEKAKVGLLVVDGACNPAALTDHLRFLAATRGVKVLHLAGLSETLRPVIRINSVVALGFAKDLPKQGLGTLCANLMTRAKVIRIPWTFAQFSTSSEKNREDTETETEKKMETETVTNGEVEDSEKRTGTKLICQQQQQQQQQQQHLVYEQLSVKQIKGNEKKTKKKKKKTKS